MRLAKILIACGLTAVACGACGITAKPLAGTARIDLAPGNHAKFNDPRVKHVRCLRQHHFPIRQYYAGSGALPAIQVGKPGVGPNVVFEPTPGMAQGAQINDTAPGAEVIGAALLYPNAEPAGKLKTIETCVALGVTG